MTGRPASQRTYTFDGTEMTYEQIRARVPMLATRRSLEHELANGRNTRDAVLSHRPKLGAARGGWTSEFSYRKELT